MGDPRPFLVNGLKDADAAQAHYSDDPNDAAAFGRPFVVGFNQFLSVTVKWADLTGTLNAKVMVECSDDGSPGSWNTKSGGVMTLTAASGGNSIAIERLQQQLWRVHFDPKDVTGGKITCVVYSH